MFTLDGGCQLRVLAVFITTAVDAVTAIIIIIIITSKSIKGIHWGLTLRSVNTTNSYVIIPSPLYHRDNVR
jgi:hypothetical protein